MSEECRNIDVDKLIKGSIVFIGQYKNCTTFSVALTCCQSLTANWTSSDNMSTPSHNASGHSPLGLSRHDSKLLVLWITNDNNNNHKLPSPLPLCSLQSEIDMISNKGETFKTLVSQGLHAVTFLMIYLPKLCKPFDYLYCGIFFICVTQTRENMLGWAWFYPLGIEK